MSPDELVITLVFKVEGAQDLPPEELTDLVRTHAHDFAHRLGTLPGRPRAIYHEGEWIVANDDVDYEFLHNADP